MKTTCDGIIGLHLSTNLDVRAMKDWPADRIAALFDGIAKVQAATAGIDANADVVTRYRLEVMDPNGDAGWNMHRVLPEGTTAEQARDAFDQTADDLDIRVRLVESRERVIAAATAKVGA
jgi:hypothetical protein